jgi:hypothetical protein
MILDIFKICYKLLRSGGKILILQPDIRYVGQNYWNYFDHHLPLSAPSVAEALEISGFIIDSVINKFLPYTMKSKIPTPPFLVYLYLKCPLIWKVMGKQCFISAHLDK